MKRKRQYTDEQLEVLAHIFKIDTGNTFRPITDEEIKAKAEAIFPKAQRDEIKERLASALDEIFKN